MKRTARNSIIRLRDAVGDRCFLRSKDFTAAGWCQIVAAGLPGILAGFAVCLAIASTVLADEQPALKKEANTAGVELLDSADPGRVTAVRYSMTITGKLLTPSGSGNTEWDLKSSAEFEFEQRRQPSQDPAPLGFRAIRSYRQAEASSRVGKDHLNELSLPSHSRLIHVYGSGSQLIQLSPEVRLTRPQVDLLQFPCDPLVMTGLLPERSLKDSSEKWNADSWVVPMLCGIDAVVNQTASCQLRSLTDQTAVVGFECSGSGAITGSPTEVTLKGEMTFDRSENLIRSLRATLTEKRSPGTVSPGLNVNVQIAWDQTLVPKSTLPESMPDESPSERQMLLTLVTPWRILLLHDREWHIFHETNELVMLRRLHNGALLAQCNIATAPLKPSGSFTSEPEYLAEVEKAVSGRGGAVQSSNVTSDLRGWRVHHVRATGDASGKTLIWDYYLCTTRSGEQISLVYSFAQEDEKLFADVPAGMLESLTLRTSRPKVALPR
jgi:hypothetical protein